MTPETSIQEKIQISDQAWNVLEGAYDLQVHVGPDVIARRIDDIDCAKEFLAHGMKGFVLKSHYIQTGERAQVVTKAVAGSKVFGAGGLLQRDRFVDRPILDALELGRADLAAFELLACVLQILRPEQAANALASNRVERQRASDACVIAR